MTLILMTLNIIVVLIVGVCPRSTAKLSAKIVGQLLRTF
jgi:hypothetical protein